MRRDEVRRKEMVEGREVEEQKRRFELRKAVSVCGDCNPPNGLRETLLDS
jgi:hypothetical protein